MALAQLENVRELGTLCVQHEITKEDLFELIAKKEGFDDRRKSKGYTLSHPKHSEV